MIEPPQLDQLASLARTALDDPGGVPELPDDVEATSQFRGPSYAVDRMDEIINTLNPSEWTRGNAAVALHCLAKHVAEVQEGVRGLADPTVQFESDPANLAVIPLDRALDEIGWAIRLLVLDEDES